ncbi:MAG TPA: hypothetical protein DCO72_03405 [Ruminococcus sp.]|nr:hypothetical protein [Ruminococcus sp.]
MSIEEFLKQLDLQLGALNPEERENAIAYYREYLEEAGEDVQSAIDSLGSPQSVAERILSEMDENRRNDFEDISLNKAKPQKTTGERLGLTIFVIILTSPIWMTVFILWITIICTLAGTLAGFGLSAVAAPIQGIMEYSQNAGQGLWDVGCGITSLGLLLLCWKPFWLAGKHLTLFLGKLCKDCINGLMGKENFT